MARQSLTCKRGKENPSCYNLSIAYDPDITICQKAYLPHWIKEGGIYAVRFRLADSLPREKLEEWQEERKELVHKAVLEGTKLTKAEQQRMDQLFSEKVERFLDAGYGECCLKRDIIAQLVADALWHFEEERYRLLAWCIMPNHVHIVLQPSGVKTLFEILDSWKHYTARGANNILERSGSFWQSESFDHLIRNQESLEKWIEYTWQNPKKADLKNWKWHWRIDGENLSSD